AVEAVGHRQRKARVRGQSQRGNQRVDASAGRPPRADRKCGSNHASVAIAETIKGAFFSLRLCVLARDEKRHLAPRRKKAKTHKKEFLPRRYKKPWRLFTIPVRPAAGFFPTEVVRHACLALCSFTCAGRFDCDCSVYFACR